MFELIVLAVIVLVIAEWLGLMDIVKLIILFLILGFILEPVETSKYVSHIMVQLHGVVQQTKDQIKD